MKIVLLFLLFVFASITICNSQSLSKSDSLQLKFLHQNQFDSALLYAEESAALVRGIFGENNLQFADALNKLVVSHFYLGNYNKANYLIAKELSVRESLKEVKDLNYLFALENASILCRMSGNYDKALVFITKAEKLASKILPRNSLEYANILCSYAGVYSDMGCAVNDIILLKKAKTYFVHANEIYSSLGEKGSIQHLVNKSNYAAYNNNIGNFPLAESTFKEVISLCDSKFGKTHPMYVSALNNLGVYFYQRANYKQAEFYFHEAVEISKNNQAENSIQNAIYINNLGAFYNDIGNYDLAAKLCIDAQEKLVKNSMYQHSNYAISLNNIATAYTTKAYFASLENKNLKQIMESGQMLMKADTIFEENIQLPNPDGYIIRMNAAPWYMMTNDAEKSLEITRDLGFQSHAGNVNSLINKIALSNSIVLLGNQDAHSDLNPIMIAMAIKTGDNLKNDSALINNTMDQDLSTLLLMRLVLGDGSKFKRKLGPFNPTYAMLLKGFSPLYWSIGDYEMEQRLTLEYINILNHNTLQDFSFLSENEKDMYFQMRLPDMYYFMDYCLRRKRSNPEITTYAYNQVLQNKGLMLKSSTAMRLAILNSQDSNLLKKYDQWISMQKELSMLYSTPVEMRTKDLKTLENKANLLEKSLVESSQLFGDFRKSLQISWKDVQKTLKPNEAAIEFTDYRIQKQNGIDKVIYCALIIKANSRYPEMIKVFEEKDLITIIGKSGENNLNYINTIYGTSSFQNEKLYNLIWKPLEKSLVAVEKIYLSPSGLLNKVSFAAISNGKNVFLCDKYQIQLKGSTGSTLNPTSFSSGNKLSALVFGGIKYSNDSTSSQVWNYLKGTKEEGDAVKNILEKKQINVQYLTDFKATETFLKKNAQNFNVLHVATHGFTFPDPNEVRKIDSSQQVEFGTIAFRGSSRGFGVNSFVNNLNPLMRSGLVLAGANDVWNNSEKMEGDDGVLTAQEVTQIDMRKNDLVVMSACETGLGEIKGSEGVYGLQRAFKMAGVKYIIMSLWQVPDKETVEFMETFYTKLLEQNDIKLAFSETQKLMRAKYDPYYWAAFVLME